MMEAGSERLVAQGSSSVEATDREFQVAELVACGFSHKRIGRTLGISVSAVSDHVSNLANKIPGNGQSKLKVAVWYLAYHGDGPI